MSVNRHFSATRQICEQEEAKELLRYEDLTTEIQCTWQQQQK